MLRTRGMFLSIVVMLMCTLLMTGCLIRQAVPDDDPLQNGDGAWEDGSTNEKQWGWWPAFDCGRTSVEVSSDWSSTGDTSLKASFTAKPHQAYGVSISPSNWDVDVLKDATSLKIDLHNPHDFNMTVGFQLRDNEKREYLARGPEFQDGSFYAGPIGQGVYTIIFDLNVLWKWPEGTEMSKEQTGVILQDIYDIVFFLWLDADSIDNVDEFHSYVYFDNIRIEK